MYKIDILEQKWKKYRFKKFFKFCITIFFALSMIILIYLFFDENEKNLYSLFQKKIEKHNPYEDKKNDFESKKNSKLMEKNLSKKNGQKFNQKNNLIKKEINQTVLLSGKESSKKTVSFLVPNYNFEKKLNIDSYDVKIEKTNHKKKSLNKTKKMINETVSSDAKPKIVTTKSNNKNFINSLVEKFMKEKDPKIALFLSKYYYKNKDYKDSLKWAVKANELDSQNEESWIIFAKSSVKLGNKKDAIKALKAYISTHQSYKAHQLLNDIQLGVFK